METFKIDKCKCHGDGLCAKVCPRSLIIFKEDRKIPLPVLGFKRLCIKCGHCVAVCPSGALSLPSMKPEDCTPIDNSLKASPEQLAQFMKTRMSVRVFKKEPVQHEVLEKLISLSDYAPTGLNHRQVNWTVFKNPEDLRHIAGMVADWMRQTLSENPALAAWLEMDKILKGWDAGADPILRGAPHLFLARANKDDRLANGAGNIVLSHLELAAHSLGLGACWAGYFQMASGSYEPLKLFLDMPEGDICLGALMIGHPDIKYSRIPARTSARVLWR